MFMLSECKSTRAHQAMSSCFTEEAYFSELGLTKNRTESLVDAAPVRRKERGIGLSRTILLRVFCTGFRLSYREPCKLILVRDVLAAKCPFCHPANTVKAPKGPGSPGKGSAKRFCCIWTLTGWGTWGTNCLIYHYQYYYYYYEVI